MSCKYYHGKCLFLNGKEEGCIACPIKRAYNKGVIDTKKDYNRPHGEWIIVDDCEHFIAKCSVCGRIEDGRMVKNYPFCRCGADMRKEEDVE